MPAIRDQEYAAVVDRERPLIEATAYLLTGDQVQAERVVQLVFAELYWRWPGVQHPRVDTLRTVVQTARRPVQLPWEPRKRVELIDGPPPLSAVAEPIVADLQMLPYEQRAAVILDSNAGLPTVQIAKVLERPVGHVPLLVQQGHAALAVGHPERTNDETLAKELQAAIPYVMREAHDSADDLTHGRWLSRRRWIARGSAALVAVVLIVAAVLLVPTRPPAPQAAPPLPISEPSRLSCDPSTPTCRSQILLKWRSKMAEITSSYLDPTGEYFSGFGYYYDNRYDTPGFWSGDGGALAFQMFRLDKGATEVYLQIATSRTVAVRCGATTRQQCSRMKFMDGNFFLLSESTLVRRGIEVQYSPSGQEVITVIARNTQRGKVLDISRGDLIKLVQDERLRLPKRCCYRR
jgi:DNA-directed RNA polymerase specialized sigma24 family protein